LEQYMTPFLCPRADIRISWTFESISYKAH
jgi:hypothetical protein